MPILDTIAFNVLSDLSILFRLSPYWTLKTIESYSEEPMKEGSKYKITIEYYGKNIIETYGLEVIELSKDRRISFRLKEGVLKEISFNIEKADDGILLINQFLIDTDDEAILKDAHSELVFWLKSISEYLKLAEGKTLWQRLFKWFMDNIWLRLTLSERKIAIIVFKISILEIILLFILILIWNLIQV